MKQHTNTCLLQLIVTLFSLFISNANAQMPGNIPGELAPTGTGAASYTIPIECPAAAGVQPGISLVYSSQAGKGIAGWGWNISGIHSITRNPQTTYFDNVSASKDITWTKTDALLYNGQRLLLDPDSTNVYRLEGDPGVLVKAYSIQSWGPAYLKVFTKEGLTLTFGKANEATSYMQVYDNARTQTNPVKVGWNLVEAEDANGNYMTISYISSLGALKGNAIRQITYGKNKRLQNSNALTVFFDYEERPDEMQGYVVGKESLQQMRLKTIRTTVDGTTQKEYRLSYVNTSSLVSGISRLSSIELYNRGIKQVKPITFTYGDGKDADNEISLNASQWNEYYNPSIGFIAIDADGDGYCELGEYFASEVSEDTYIAKLNIRKYSRNWNIERTLQTGTHDWDGTSPIHLYGDFNGNGTTDHVYLSHTGDISEGNVHQNIDIKITDLSNGSTFFNLSPALNTTKAPFLSIGKCNGLPFASLVVVNKDAVGLRYYYQVISRTAESATLTTLTNTSFTSPRAIENIEVVKLGNFEYYDDLFLTLDNGTNRIVVNNQSDGAKYTGDQIKNPNLTIGNDYHQFVDFNGDGLTDIVYRKIENNKSVWRVALNKGNYTFQTQELSFISNQENIFRAPYTVNYHDQDILLFIDINNDGLIDIVSGDEQLNYKVERKNGVLHYTYDFARTSWTIYLNNGNGFREFSGGISYAKANRSCLGDLLGKGKISWLYSNSYGEIVIRDFRFKPNQNLLTAINNPVGGTTTLEYKAQPDDEISITNSTDNGSVVTQQQYIDLGYLPFKSPVSHVFSRADNGLTKFAYRYGKPLINWKYRNFIGYRYIEKRDVKTDIAELTVNGFPVTGRNYYIMLPLFKWTYKGNNYTDSIIAKETYQYTVKSYANQKGRYAIQPTSTTTKRYLAGESTTTTVNESYDNWNNVLTTYTEAQGQKVQNAYTYGSFGAWCNNKVTRDSQTTTSLTDGSNIYKTSLFTFDSRGNLTEHNNYYMDVKPIVTRYTDYDIYGHPLRVEVITDIVSQNTYYTYTTTGRFMASETNPFGETISYAWNEEKGLMTSSTDRTGTTLYTYNASYDYLTRITYPTGLTETHTLAWDATNPGGYYRQQSRADLPGSTIKTYYDMYGREIMTERYGPTGTKLYTYTEYYPDGRLHLTTKPGYMSRPLDKSYTYDKYGRVASIRTIEDSITVTYGSSNSTLASNYIEEKTASGHITRKNWNTYGQLATVTTDGKAVNFTYSAGNRLKTSTPDGGGTIQMQYDTHGNRTKIIDPDVGTISSMYNARGQLTWETQNKHNNQIVTTNYFYTSTGLLRLKQIRNSSAGTLEATAYEYDSRNRLIKSYIVGGNHTFNYEYDNFDRITKSTETIKGQPFVFKYEYDTSNRVTKETYPTEYYITNTYLYGYLKKVTDIDNHVVWELTAVNDRGEISSEKKNGISTTFAYDSFTQQIASIKSTGIVDMNYTYYVPYTAKGGNLKTYRDGISNQQETYTYDNMDRLVNWKTPTDSYPFNNITYNNNRIGHKYDPLDYGNSYTYRTSTSNQIDYIGDDSWGEYTPSAMQEIQYTDFNKVKSIVQEVASCTIEYGVGEKQVYMKSFDRYYTLERYYAGKYERESKAGATSRMHYIYGGNGLAAIYIIKNDVGTLYSTYTDRQGSLVAITNGSTVIQRNSFDPWGKRRNPSNWLLKDSREHSTFLSSRGYTLHEHMDTYGLINMNARMYDPLTSTFISPDPQLQMPGNWMNYNRYAYGLNNPLKYSDSTGEFLEWVAVGIGVLAGIYMGGVAANGGEWNPTKWDYQSGKTWGYMIGGGIVGAGSAYLGVTIAASGGIMANTGSIFATSYAFSYGMSVVTMGKTDFTVSIGAVSLNMSTGSVGYLGKKGNSFIENLGYAYGTIANIEDVLSGLNPANGKLWTEDYVEGGGKDKVGHSQFTDMNDNSLIDWGPLERTVFKTVPGTNSYEGGGTIPVHKLKGGKPLVVRNVNMDRMTRYSDILNKGGDYNMLYSSCVTKVSWGLNMSGVFNIGIHPHLLYWQMYLRSFGFTPSYFSSLFYTGTRK